MTINKSQIVQKVMICQKLFLSLIFREEYGRSIPVLRALQSFKLVNISNTS